MKPRSLMSWVYAAGVTATIGALAIASTIEGANTQAFAALALAWGVLVPIGGFAYEILTDRE
jgi:hypothetical protein